MSNTNAEKQWSTAQEAKDQPANQQAEDETFYDVDDIDQTCQDMFANHRTTEENAASQTSKYSNVQTDRQQHLKSLYLRSFLEECSITDSDIEELRVLVSPLEFDDLTLARFLAGCDMSVKTAAQKLQQDNQWREKVKPHLLPASYVEPMIRHGEVVELNQRDKQGFPVIYMRVRFHNMFQLPAKMTYIEMMLCMAENILKKGERASGIVDMHSIKWKNVDISMTLEGLNLYNNHYPERLGNIVFMGGEFWFEYGLKMLKHLIGPRTVPRIHYVKTLEEIEQFIDPAALPEDCVLLRNKVAHMHA